MTYKRSLKRAARIFLITAHSISSSTFTTTTVPWQSTFSGINATNVVTNAIASPFQSPGANQTITTNQSQNNPFLSSDGNSKVNVHKASQSIATILANPNATLAQKSNAAFTTNTSVGGAALKITPKTKLQTTALGNALGNLTNISFTQVQQELKKPTGPLFPHHPQLETAYTNFMNAMHETPSFLPLFKKIHITALHQIYLYLTGIYTALNMTHIDDVKSYMITEKQYALNKKTLIINHMLALVMAQLNQSLRALLPGIPENYALNAGMACVQSDKISDPNIFILDMEQSVLAVLGLEKLEPSQITATYLALKKYIPLLAIPESPALTAAMQALGTTSFSAKHLSQEEAHALDQALNHIIAYCMQQQTLTNFQTLADSCAHPAQAQPSSQDMQRIQKFISKLVFGQELKEVIEFCRTFSKLLTLSPSTKLTLEQIQKLKSSISYILERYETASTQQLSQIIQLLGQLNPSYQVLSPSQSCALKTLATSMLSPTHPLMLEHISTKDRSLLAYGLLIASNQSGAAQSDASLLQNLAVNLKKHPMTEESLSASQKTILQKTLTTFASYQLQPLSSTAFQKQAQQRLATLKPSLSETEQESIITQALQTINSGKFTSFDQLTQTEQIVLLELFQLVDQVLETQRSYNQKNATALSHLFADDTSSQNALFLSISSSQYETLNAIGSLLAQTTTSLSVGDLLQVSPPSTLSATTSWMNPQTALLTLFATPGTTHNKPTKSTGQTAKGTSYYSLLLSMQKEHFSDPVILKIIYGLNAAEINEYKALLPLFKNPHFSFSMIPLATAQSLAALFNKYIALEKSITKKTYSGPSGLTDPQLSALETVANVVRYTHQNTNMRSSFLWTLQQYLIFFNNYAQLLEVITSDAQNPSYKGLTEFATAAQNIQKTLLYESSDNGIAKLIEQTNPPLFFYDQKTFETLRILPKLAQLVQNSSVAPYPTFGIEQAISPNGSAIDPLTGQTVTNTTTLGPAFAYQKFFFLQAPDATTELTASLPSWIKAVTVPASTGQTTVYEPSVFINDGITGFYMNLPTFQQDPMNKNSALIRLYQQPIIAQPLWLNQSTTAKSALSGIVPQNKAGVTTIVRGCVGDFLALLDLGIFDPCLTIIFKKAAATTQGVSKEPLPSFSQQEANQCSSYIAEKQANLAKQASPVATTAISAVSNTSSPSLAGGA